MCEKIIVADSLNFNDIIFYPKIEIHSGVTTFICGESGCGKSTLLRIFNSTVLPKCGEIYFEGKHLYSYDTLELRKQMLLVAQSVFLFDKTIKENFEEFFSYLDMPSPDDKTIFKFLNMCNIDFPIDTLCTSMSGGERQRIYLAIFLSFMPSVLMLDEPTSALDSKTASSVIGNIKTFCKQNSITLIVVSHDKNIIENFADEVIDLFPKGV